MNGLAQGDIGRSDRDRPSDRRRAAGDLAIIILLAAAVVGILAHAPSRLYAYAQLKRASEAVGILQTGNWLLPPSQTGAIATKPQLYPWLTAGVLRLTGVYHDFTFCLPNAAAYAAAAVLVYLLGRRWHGRRVGLLAACLWATVLHMGRMAYLATTDMFLALWIAASIFCADRLAFHRGRRCGRWKWAAGLWAAMVLGAMTKGWGLVNTVLVGLALGLAAAVGPGFRALRAVQGAGRKGVLALRLILRRWRRLARDVRLGWGLLAMAAVLVPIWIAMLVQGGQEFRRLIYFEFWQRVTGAGEYAPKAAGAPAPLQLLYYLLPASALACGALALVPPRRWFRRKGPLCLPLCWIIAVVGPFWLAHGFRPDYLLPCYAAGALMAAWMVEELAGRRLPGRPDRPHPAASVLRRLAWAMPIIMLGVILLESHVVSRHACTGDGETMLRFARAAGPIVGADDLAVYRAAKLSVEPYLGRLGARVAGVEDLNRVQARWLVTCDRGLAQLGAYVEDPNGPYIFKADRGGGGQQRLRIRPRPEDLGESVLASPPVVSQNWGCIHLIRLARPIKVSGTPLRPAWESGKPEDDEDSED